MSLNWSARLPQQPCFQKFTIKLASFMCAVPSTAAPVHLLGRLLVWCVVSPVASGPWFVVAVELLPVIFMNMLAFVPTLIYNSLKYLSLTELLSSPPPGEPGKGGGRCSPWGDSSKNL